MEASALMATDTPKRSLAFPSAAVSLAVSVRFAQPPSGLANRYVPPCPPLLDWSAPTTTAEPSPLAATATPKTSPVPPSEAVSLAAWVPLDQEAPTLENTYAAPCAACPATVANGAPTTTVEASPLKARGSPKRSTAAPSEAVSLATSVTVDQPLAGRTKR